MKQTKKRSDKKSKKDEGEGIFIPAGLFIGMGFGFLLNELVAGMFLGLGVGFLLFAIAKVFKKDH